MQTLENLMRTHGRATDDDAAATPEGDARARDAHEAGPDQPTLVTKPNA